MLPSTQQNQKKFIDLTVLKLWWRSNNKIFIGFLSEKMGRHCLKRKKSMILTIHQAQRTKEIGIRLEKKSIEILNVMLKIMEKTQVWNSSSKYSKMVIQKKEKLWWRVSKLVEEPFSLLIGMMSLRKTTKERIGHLLQKANNGKKKNIDDPQINKQLLINLFDTLLLKSGIF